MIDIKSLLVFLAWAVMTMLERLMVILEEFVKYLQELF